MFSDPMDEYMARQGEAACLAYAVSKNGATAVEWRDHPPLCRVFYPSAPYGKAGIAVEHANGDVGHKCFVIVSSGPRKPG